MIGNSLREWILIRFSILVFQYTPILYVVPLVCIVLRYGTLAKDHVSARVLGTLLLAEGVFYIFGYLPRLRQMNETAQHPTPMSTEERQELFRRCTDNMQHPELYLRGWFLGADLSDIRRENLREFILWAFFERGDSRLDNEDSLSIDEEVNGYVADIEDRLGRRLDPGRGPAKSLRLTLDPVETTYRSLLWYITIFIIDQACHAAMWWSGFKYYARGPEQALRTFPPRPQELISSRRSPAPELGYWYHEHRDEAQLPVVFFHGIGVGLWTYVRFLADLRKARRSKNSRASIGIIAVEFLPVSFRLTGPPPRKEVFLQQMDTVLKFHGWNKFTAASHSYGSVTITHLLRCPEIRPKIASVMLIDPVTIMLHLPHVAYNFTRRRPQEANEWQLWYFASTDPGVAQVLGRHFFWRENIIWKEELVAFQRDSPAGDGRVAVSLAGKDLILNAPAVADYLGAGRDPDEAKRSGNLSILWFPKLDHAQVFDHKRDFWRVIDHLLLDQRAI